MLSELVKKSRSFRNYDNSIKLSRDELLKIVEVSRFCPSTMNLQALKYHISYKEDEVNKILPLTRWAVKLKDVSLPFKGKEPTAFITIAVDTKIGSYEAFQRDVGIVSQTMLLKAVEDGFGGIIIANLDKARLASLLSLPKSLEISVVIALGKPDEEVIVVDALGNDTDYYRDETKLKHFVPKRKVEDLLF
ncbi:MAG: nitroreductase family protein [Sphaerochaetaceae bacterium]|nr:nitroreductase family protein [Sphaerochaetaceae bacterium]